MTFHDNQHMRFRNVLRTLAPALALAAAAAAQVNIGVLGGLAGSVTEEGVAGFGETKFKPTNAYGATFNYRFPSGLSIGVRAEQFRMPLREGSDALGNLQMRPVMVTIGGQGRPPKGRGLTGHGQIGGGVSLCRFEKGSAITDLERMFGARVDVRTKTAPVFEMGGGLDYFISRHVSFTTDFRILLSNVGTSWYAVGRQSVQIDNIEKFFASNAQAIAGVRIWLW